MKENKQPRLLNADEIDVRVKTWDKTNKAWAMLLLYKDARVDQRLMDETYGAMNWKRSHELIDGNLYCTVSVWNAKTSQWVSKQDVGTESDTEKEKGQASDSFKRACFNWGIGRELYTAPAIFIKTTPADYTAAGKFKTELTVSLIKYNEAREIIALELRDGKGTERFHWSKELGVHETWVKPAEYKKQQEAKTTAAKKVERVKEIAKALNAEPAPAPKTPVTTTELPAGFTQQDFISILEQVDACKTKADVKAVHAAFPQLAGYAPFRNACNNKFSQCAA